MAKIAASLIAGVFAFLTVHAANAWTLVDSRVLSANQAASCRNMISSGQNLYVPTRDREPSNRKIPIFLQLQLNTDADEIDVIGVTNTETNTRLNELRRHQGGQAFLRQSIDVGNNPFGNSVLRVFDAATLDGEMMHRTTLARPFSTHSSAWFEFSQNTIAMLSVRYPTESVSEKELIVYHKVGNTWSAVHSNSFGDDSVNKISISPSGGLIGLGSTEETIPVFAVTRGGLVSQFVAYMWPHDYAIGSNYLLATVWDNDERSLEIVAYDLESGFEVFAEPSVTLALPPVGSSNVESLGANSFLLTFPHVDGPDGSRAAGAVFIVETSEASNGYEWNTVLAFRPQEEAQLANLGRCRVIVDSRNVVVGQRSQDNAFILHWLRDDRPAINAGRNFDSEVLASISASADFALPPEAVTASSDVRVTLDAPTLISPNPRVDHIDRYVNRRFYYEWSKVDGADSYDLREETPDTRQLWQCCPNGRACVASPARDRTFSLANENYCTDSRCYYVSWRETRRQCNGQPFQQHWTVTPLENNQSGDPSPRITFDTN